MDILFYFILVLQYLKSLISNNEDSDQTDKNEMVHTNKNYGNRVVGPWVFGICWKQPDLLLEWKFFYRKKRK